MTVSADDQIELGSTPALLMGPGTHYEWVTFDGLGMPSIRNADQDLVGDGVYAARDTKAGRTVSIDVEITGTSSSDLITNLTTFATAWQSTNTDITLTYRLPGQGNRYVNGRPRRCAWKWDVTAEVGPLIHAFVDFFCQDPRVFLSADNSVVIF